MFSEYGYFKEYYIGTKYIGTLNNVAKDRDIMGFHGTKEEITMKEIVLSNKKKIKINTKVTTQLQILNGRIL